MMMMQNAVTHVIMDVKMVLGNAVSHANHKNISDAQAHKSLARRGRNKNTSRQRTAQSKSSNTIKVVLDVKFDASGKI